MNTYYRNYNDHCKNKKETMGVQEKKKTGEGRRHAKKPNVSTK